jgi:adenylosuccinate synthase
MTIIFRKIQIIMKAYVVIGSCFGDEGKGLITDYLSSMVNKDAIVVRFNGGAQAGHTVVTPSDERHVFRHFGSGCFTGCTTYLSEFFICNPILFHQEWKELNNLSIKPKVFVDPSAIVTTPYDMMINQIIEMLRADNKHGSCGVGINETVERSKHERYCIRVQEIFDETQLSEHSILSQKLLSIQQEWVPRRLSQLGIQDIELLSKEWQQRLLSKGILEYFISEIRFFVKHCDLSEKTILHSFPAVIFEGAQGLLLDEEKGFFPHVTRSATGLKNVLKIAKQLTIQHLDVFYIARTYLTRHGAGPLPFEKKRLPYATIIDQTNSDNTYQGSLRFAPFNFDLLKKTIVSDLAQVTYPLQLNVNLMITCADQLHDEIQYILENELITASKSEFLNQIESIFSDFRIWYSTGNTRLSVTQSKLRKS